MKKLNLTMGITFGVLAAVCMVGAYYNWFHIVTAVGCLLLSADCFNSYRSEE